MVESNSYSGITGCFKNGSGKNEQENPHAQCSQSRN
jgi:hypothetical protein